MKKILITGGSDGIGLEVAKLLAAQQNQIVLVARNADKLEKAIRSLPGTGHSYLTADLSKKDGIHSIADSFSTTHYDVLINCAGIGMYGRFEDLPISNTINMLQLNMYALTVLCHSYLKSAQKGDSIVNLSSTLGITSFPGLSAYTATKAYVDNFSNNLWWENKNKGVYVLSFCPGATDTNFHEAGGGHRNSFPKWVMQQPQQVAKELVIALERRRKPRVVSGLVNRAMLFFQRFMSRAFVVKMMGGFSPLAKPANSPASFPLVNS